MHACFLCPTLVLDAQILLTARVIGNHHRVPAVDQPEHDFALDLATTATSHNVRRRRFQPCGPSCFLWIPHKLVSVLQSSLSMISNHLWNHLLAPNILCSPQGNNKALTRLG